MAERASIFQGNQIGLEATPGVNVPADKKLLATSFMFGPNPQISTFRPNGSKFITIASLDREWVEGSIEGLLAYTDIVYLLSSLTNKVTPALVDTTGQAWTFSSNTFGPDDPATFTVEQGSSVRAHKFNHGLVTGLGFHFSNDGAEIDGTIIGQALQDGITMTAAPTEIDLVPVMRPQVLVYIADTYAGLASATAQNRVLAYDWSLTDRFNPVWALNGQVDFEAFVEGEPGSEVNMLMEADTEGMALLPEMREGNTVFVRVEATGGLIGAGPATYGLVIDSAIKITDAGDFEDEEGVFAIEWVGELTHDSTWGKAFEITATNDLTEL